MMPENIILKRNPKIEFQMFELGFQLIDEQTVRNSGFYAYNDLQSVELNRTWFPRLTKWLRVFSAICNFVPLFPDAETCKSAHVKFHFSNMKFLSVSLKTVSQR